MYWWDMQPVNEMNMWCDEWTWLHEGMIENFPLTALSLSDTGTITIHYRWVYIVFFVLDTWQDKLQVLVFTCVWFCVGGGGGTPLDFELFL